MAPHDRAPRRRWYRRPIVLTAAGILLVALGFVTFFRSGGTTEQQTATVTRGTVTQEVSVTGRVEPFAEVSLAFERSGRIRRVAAAVGSAVSPGQVLVELDHTELDAGLAQAQAEVARERANLDALRRGTRPEEVAVKRVEREKADQDLRNEYTGVVDVIQDAYAKADDAVRSKVDALFLNGEGENPTLTFLVSNSQAENDARVGRRQSRNALNVWKPSLVSIVSSATTAMLALSDARKHLTTVRAFLITALDAVSSAAGISASTAGTYTTNIATARTNVNAALAAVSAKEQAIATQQFVVARIESELALTLAGATADQVAAQVARVAQAEASVQNVRAQIRTSVLSAPLTGVVTVQDAKVGEIAVPNHTVVTIISKREFQIEANIPEADITKVRVGNAAAVTLDAYGPSVVFGAAVTKIDPGETVIEGVSTYRTTLRFGTEDDRVRSGMTANVDIVTEVRREVLTLPQWALTGRDGTRVARLRNADGSLREVTVATGLRGSDGSVEITGGLSEGDVIVASSTAK